MLEPRCQVVCQRPAMDEQEREAFLAAFQREPESTLVGFAVLGGIFGEGIDLVGERLSGAVIVGVGLPQVCQERDLICLALSSVAERLVSGDIDRQHGKRQGQGDHHRRI